MNCTMNCSRSRCDLLMPPNAMTKALHPTSYTHKQTNSSKRFCLCCRTTARLAGSNTHMSMWQVLCQLSQLRFKGPAHSGQTFDLRCTPAHDRGYEVLSGIM